MSRLYVPGSGGLGRASVLPASAAPPPSWDPTQGAQGGASKLLVLPSGLVDDGSGKVSAWTDVSGAGLLAPVQATSGKRPTIITAANGQKAARVSGAQILDCGAGLVLGGNTSQPFTIFVVASFPSGPNQYDCLVGRQGSSNGFGITAQSSVGFSFYTAALVSTVKNTRNIFDGTPRTIIGSWDGANNITTRCGGRIVSVTSGYTPPLNENASDHVTIGGAYGAGGSNANFATADIHAVWIIRGTPTAADITNFNAWAEYYFGAKEWKTKSLFCGDSITVGYNVDGNPSTTWDGTQLAWSCQYLKTLGRAWGDPVQDAGNEHHGTSTAAQPLAFNLSYTGETLSQIASLDMAQIAPYDTEFRNWVIVSGGSNDIAFGAATSVAQYLANMALASTAARAPTNGGSKVKVFGWIPVDRQWDNTGGQTIAQKTATWQAVKAALRAGGSSWVTAGIDGIVDPTLDARFDLGGSLSNTIYIDGIHLSAAGCAALGQIVASQLLGVQ